MDLMIFLFKFFNWEIACKSGNAVSCFHVYICLFCYQFMNETTVFVQPLINVLPPYNHSTKRVLLPRITNGVLLNKSSVLLEPIITSTPLRPGRSRRQANKKKKNNNKANVSSFLKSTPLENFIRILKQPTQSRKILQLSSSTITSPPSSLCDTTLTNSLSMLPSMPNLSTPVKNNYEDVTTPISEVSSTRNILKNLAEELNIEPVENCKEADTSNESTSQLCIEKAVSKEVSKPVPEHAPITSLSTNPSTSAPKILKEKVSETAIKCCEILIFSIYFLIYGVLICATHYISCPEHVTLLFRIFYY